MTRDRYAAEALNLISLIDADVEAAGQAISGVTLEEAVEGFHRLFDAMRVEDAVWFGEGQ